MATVEKTVKLLAEENYSRSMRASQEAMDAAKEGRCKTALVQFERSAEFFGRAEGQMASVLASHTTQQGDASDLKALALGRVTKMCVSADLLSGLGGRRRRRSRRTR